MRRSNSKEIGRRAIPLEEAMEIQKALKPLGYVVQGYRDKERVIGGIVLHLTRGGNIFKDYLANTESVIDEKI